MPEVVEADAPGRVNLIGEHTDYHEGYVLPTIIPQRTRVRLTGRADRRVRASSAEQGAPVGRRIRLAKKRQDAGGWTTSRASRPSSDAAASRVPGFDVRIASDIPVGAGVSSSAALTVSLLRGLRTLMDLHIDDVALAKLAQAAETDFVGAPVGIMDPMVCSLGRADEALFLDTRTLDTDRVPLPPSIEAAGHRFWRQARNMPMASTSHDGVSHSKPRSLLGVEHLRDLDRDSWSRLDRLPPTLARRARHIVTENQRVLAAVAALQARDAVRMGQLMAESHASMRDDYEISTPDVDALVAIGQQHPDIFGARMTGGGFGGAVVLIAKAGAGTQAARVIRDRYISQRGRQAEVLVPPDA